MEENECRTKEAIDGKMRMMLGMSALLQTSGGVGGWVF